MKQRYRVTATFDLEFEDEEPIQQLVHARMKAIADDVEDFLVHPHPQWGRTVSISPDRTIWPGLCCTRGAMRYDPRRATSAAAPHRTHR